MSETGTRVYRVRAWVRWTCAAVTVVGVGPALGLGYLYASGDNGTPATLAIAGVLGAFGLAAPAYLLPAKVVLTSNRLEMGSWRLRGIDRRDIADYEVRMTPTGTQLRLIARDGDRRRLPIVPVEMFEFDDVFTDWLESLKGL